MFNFVWELFFNFYLLLIFSGVVCFPYGLILDKAFELLDRIEFVIRQREEVDVIKEFGILVQPIRNLLVV